MQSIGSHAGHHICLTSTSKTDIICWYLFAEKWDGISLLWDNHTLLLEFNIYSDASGSWGCGGYWGCVGFSLIVPSLLLLRSSDISSNIWPSVEGSLGSILSRQFGSGLHPQINIQQRLTPHALSMHLRVLSSSI